MIVWDKAKIRFTYSSSDPKEVKPESLDSNKDKQYYTVGDGMIRIWTKDADKARKKEPLEDADGNAGGDFIPGKKAQPEGGSGGEDKGYEFLANKLFTGTEENGEIKPVDLFIEGIGKGTTSGLIKVEFSPKGDTTWMPDEVKVSTVKIDAKVDSDNDGIIAEADTPERLYEDAIEAAVPGEIISVNDGDFDGDGIPDYVDGFSAFSGSKYKLIGESVGTKPTFTPLVLEIPEPLDMKKIQLKINYSTSNPNQVTRTGNAKQGYTYILPKGNFRIWRKNADVPRNKNSTLTATNGDWIEPGEYKDKALERLLKFPDTDGNDRKFTFWIEAVSAKNIKPEITFSVDPDGPKNGKEENPAEYIYSDIVCIQPVSFTRLTDVSGYLVNNLQIERIPADIEPTGIACDGLNGVDDGAFLLLRIIVPKDLYSYFSSAKLDYGYAKGGFKKLPADKTEGEYLPVSGSDRNVFRRMGIEMKGDSLQDGSKVLSEIIYRPPVEFDMKNPDNRKIVDKIRELTLTAKCIVDSGASITSNKCIVLTRPPVMLVHGINGTIENVFVKPAGFTAALEKKGFIWFGANHNNKASDNKKPYAEGKELYGNGTIDKEYKFIMDAIYEKDKDKSALVSYRKGNSFNGKKIAVQKCDIVAHSYGGLLARWYSEQSPEYKTRRDIRKIITSGTPHRGSPITNMMCETYKNPIFFNARSGAYYNDTFTVGYVFNKLHTDGTVIWYKKNGTPGVTGADESYLVPALQIISLNSPRLIDLNTNPFNDDIAYGAIVGTKNTVTYKVPTFTSSWDVSEPFFNYSGTHTNFTNDKSYFPWITGLETKGDSIVPEWSQTLPGASVTINVDHINETGNTKVQNQVATWLQDENLNKGKDIRGSFTGANILDDQTRKNAYKIARLEGDVCIGAGVKREAIVMTEFTPDAGADYTINQDGKPELGSRGGVVFVRCTGMIDNNNRTLSVIQDGDLIGLNFDTKLHNIKPSPSSSSNYLVTFDVKGKIGRATNKTSKLIYENIIRGPDGSQTSRFWNDWDVGYEMSGGEYKGFALQSPPSRIIFPTRILPVPVGGNTVTETGSSYVLEGGVHATVNGGGTQSVTVNIYDSDTILDPDDLLVKNPFNLTTPAESFKGILVPYRTEARLFKNTKGEVAGKDGTSGEAEAEIYQYIVDPYGLSSETISLKVSE